MSSVILYGHTAAFYYCSTSEQMWSRMSANNRNPLLDCAQTTMELSAFDITYPGFGPFPLQLLVSEKAFCRCTSTIQCHYLTQAINTNGFAKLGDGLYACSPELCFVQCASTMPFLQLVELGINLCASYYIDPYTKHILPRQKPITTPGKLQSYIQKHSYLHGTQVARRAAKYIHNGSESPMETVCQMLIGMPKAEGGYGLSGFECNPTIKTGRFYRLMDQTRFRADICWKEQKVVLEYDGKQFHEDAHRDKHRSNALESLGWTVYFATSREVFDLNRFDVLARQIARSLSWRLQLPRDWRQRAVRLRRHIDLLPSSEEYLLKGLFPKQSYFSAKNSAFATMNQSKGAYLSEDGEIIEQNEAQ